MKIIEKIKNPIFLGIVVILIGIMAIVVLQYNNKDEKEPKNNNEEIIETEKNSDDMGEIKVYLSANYDKFSIDGSTSMIPLHQSLNGVFKTVYEKVTHSKTVESFENFISGKTDILLGVDYSDELLNKAKENGIDLVKKPITREAFVFLINKNNPVKSLTIEQIKDIYSGKITNWKEVGGDDAKIKAYQRNEDSGSQIRMKKFMGDIKLTDRHVDYISSMWTTIDKVSNYDEGKYSIAYNMYTFTENQYFNNDVIFLAINGILPSDEKIFDETYPISIYNYIYYDKNNIIVSEFVNKLYTYLMSNEGQSMINDSGYVNLNKNDNINKNIHYIPNYGNEEYIEIENISWMNKEKGEFYGTDNDGNLLIYKNYPDYVLRDSKYRNNENARNFLTRFFNSGFGINQYTVNLNLKDGIIKLNLWIEALDSIDLFTLKYDNKYYINFEYHIEQNKYILKGIDNETYEYYKEDVANEFPNYINNIAIDSIVEITPIELKELYLRISQYEEDLRYTQPFK